MSVDININDSQLASFKSRMHITHKAEDEYLRSLLASSASYVMRIGNVDYIESPEAFEMVCERARYAYNDKLQDFDTDYLSPMLNLSIANMEVPTDGESN